MAKKTFIRVLFMMLLFSADVMAQNIPSYVPANGLVGWWPFNGNANDESGNGNHGTVNGATLTTDRYGNAGRAYAFDGINNLISIGNPAAFSFQNGQSISFWMKAGSFPATGGESVLISQQSSSSTNAKGYNISFSETGSINYRIGNGSAGSFAGLINNNLSLNKWFHIVCQFQSGTIQIFVNSALINSGFQPNAGIGFSNTQLRIGDDTWGASNAFFYSGLVDDLCIMNRALTQTEITKLYQAGLEYSISTQLDGNCAGGTVNLTAATAVSLNTTAAGNITNNSAISGGSIINDGGQTITQRGVCWSTSPNPTIALSTKTSDGSGSGTFSSSLTGLSASTTYYVRAYATSTSGTWYGDEKSFTTLAPVTTVNDIDGNVYNTVTIGTQIWMKENLKVSKYRNGNSIPTGMTDAVWTSTSTGAYAVYNNDPAFNSAYGKLYNWYAVTDSRGLCPVGWHVPTDQEWFTLESFLDPTINNPQVEGWRGTDGGGKMKSASTLWSSPNSGVSNSSGFSALPGGFRDISMYNNLNITGVWWTSTVKLDNDCWYRGLRFDYSQVDRKYYSKNGGFSIRCIKD